jgi:transposase-like protein
MENQKKISPKYSPEVRERAVRMVFDHADQYPSQWAATTSIAAKIGCSTQTLTNWVRQAERDRGQKAGRDRGPGDPAEADGGIRSARTEEAETSEAA